MSNASGTPSQVTVLWEERNKVPQHMWGCPWERDGFPLAADFLLQLQGCAKGGNTCGPARLRTGALGTLLLSCSHCPLVFLLGKVALKTETLNSCKCCCAGIVLQ